MAPGSIPSIVVYKGGLPAIAVLASPFGCLPVSMISLANSAHSKVSARRMRFAILDVPSCMVSAARQLWTWLALTD